MSDSVSVKKIVVKVGKKEFELSLDEAKELQALLNETFGDKEVVYIPGAPVYVPTVVYSEPLWRYWTVTCDNTTITYSANSN